MNQQRIIDQVGSVVIWVLIVAVIVYLATGG